MRRVGKGYMERVKRETGRDLFSLYTTSQSLVRSHHWAGLIIASNSWTAEASAEDKARGCKREIYSSEYVIELIPEEDDQSGVPYPRGGERFIRVLR